MVPKSVTIAMATVTSSSSAPAVSSMAAMAEAPQMAVPVPMSRLLAGLSPIRRPTQVVTTRVPTRLTATTAMSGRPRAAIEPNDTEKPSRTMPTRRSFLVTRASERDARPGQDPDVGGDDAQADRPGEHADRGHEPVTEEGTTEAERQDGERRGRGCATPSTAPRARRWSRGSR